MDASKLDMKVVRMLSVNKKRVVESVPTVEMPEILRMKERARKENKTLAQIFNEETKPELFGTISLDELRKIQEENPGKPLGKEVKKAIEEQEGIKSDEPKDSTPPVQDSTETEEVPEQPASDLPGDLSDDEPGNDDPAEEDKPGDLSYEEMLNSKTYVELKDFAKANDMDIKSNIKKAALIEHIMLKADHSIVESYFGE